MAKLPSAPPLSVSLPRQQVWNEQGFRAGFAIDDFRRHCLLEGLDEIALTLRHEREIANYEQRLLGAV